MTDACRTQMERGSRKISVSQSISYLLWIKNKWISVAPNTMFLELGTLINKFLNYCLATSALEAANLPVAPILLLLVLFITQDNQFWESWTSSSFHQTTICMHFIIITTFQVALKIYFNSTVTLLALLKFHKCTKII